MRSAARGRVTGRVQGVGFRYSAQREAQALGLSGWVQNLSDGSVAFEVWGGSEQVQAFLQWLERGPLLAKVSALHHEEFEPPASDLPFEQRR